MAMPFSNSASASRWNDKDDNSTTPLDVASQNSLYPEPNIALIGELIEHIERNPQEVEAKRLLMQQYMACGWFEAARDVAQQILISDSLEMEARACLKKCATLILSESRNGKEGKGKEKEGMRGVRQISVRKAVHEESLKRSNLSAWRPTLIPVTCPSSALRELEEGYKALLEKAQRLDHEMKPLRGLDGMRVLADEDAGLDLAALGRGKVSSALKVKSRHGVKEVAEAMKAIGNTSSDEYLNVVVKDLEDAIGWLRSHSEGGKRLGKAAADDIDEIRESLVKRVRALKALLPSAMQEVAETALMHVEHELLHRTYVNGETMLGDEVSDIPREHFWVSEDGYAWDMEELAQAITSNGGVMRNPLSKLMFTPADIRAIVGHPYGKRLAALQIEQSKLKRGVRPTTVNELEKLAKILLEDLSEDQMPSRLAVEGFAAYIATLPGSEQKAIDELKVPAKDSHTRMEFDTTIGEAVRDAQGNRVCFHKTGDFLGQAAKHLRRKV